MSYAVHHQIELATEDCCICGVVFALPASLKQHNRESGESFYCPTGHKQRYTRTEIDRLRDKLAEQTRVATHMAERARAAELAEQAAMKKLGRMEKRAKAGLCPCCNRSFAALARHMKSKHPEYAGAPTTDVVIARQETQQDRGARK